MSKIFTESLIQQNILPKPSAENPNALWLLLNHNNTLPQLTHQHGKALARHRVVSVLPPEHFAHQTPSHAEVTSPHQKTHSSTSCPASTRINEECVPCVRAWWPRWLLRDPDRVVAVAGPRAPGTREHPPEPKPFPELGPLPGPSFASSPAHAEAARK